MGLVVGQAGTEEAEFNFTGTNAGGYPGALRALRVSGDLDRMPPLSLDESWVIRLAPGDLLQVQAVGTTNFTGKTLEAQVRLIRVRTESYGPFGIFSREVRTPETPNPPPRIRSKLSLGHGYDLAVYIQFLGGTRPPQQLMLSHGPIDIRMPAAADVRLVLNAGSAVWTNRAITPNERQQLDAEAERLRVAGGYREVEWVDGIARAGNLGEFKIRVTSDRP